MNKTRILAIAGVVTTLFVVHQYYTILCSENALFEMYPDIATSDIIAASRKMYFAALRGEFANVDTNDDAVMETIFLSYVNNL